MLSVIIAAAGTCAFCQLHMLNNAMKLYDQLEVIPIYQTALMIMWILSGLVIFEEIHYYQGTQLGLIAVGIVTCCTGMKILTMKKKIEQEERPQVASTDCSDDLSKDSFDDIEEPARLGIQLSDPTDFTPEKLRHPDAHL